MQIEDKNYTYYKKYNNIRHHKVKCCELSLTLLGDIEIFL